MKNGLDFFLLLEALKKVYLVFDIAPYVTRLARSVRKEHKYYFWDWGILEDPGKRKGSISSREIIYLSYAFDIELRFCVLVTFEKNAYESREIPLPRRILIYFRALIFLLILSK